MTAIKIVEIIGTSNKSFEDAAKVALKRTAKTVKNILWMDVHKFGAKVDKNKITQYQAHCKIAFAVK